MSTPCFCGRENEGFYGSGKHDFVRHEGGANVRKNMKHQKGCVFHKGMLTATSPTTTATITEASVFYYVSGIIKGRCAFPVFEKHEPL